MPEACFAKWVAQAMFSRLVQVVTKRTKNLKKQEIPSLDDPISKLNHIGKETVKKLNELAASAAEASLHLPIPLDLHRYAFICLRLGRRPHGILTAKIFTWRDRYAP